MNKFNYRVKDEAGRYQSGEIEALDIKQAVNVLREHKLFVIKISPRSRFFSGIRGRVSGADVAHFTRYLSTMLMAGLPLTESLSNLQDQTGGYFSEVISALARDVAGGSSLATAMARRPRVFSDLYINMVKSGEASGKVDEVLERLADSLDVEQDFKGKLQGAMVYPAIVVTIMFIVAIIMLLFVIPKISEAYAEFGADLPLPTQILIGVSSFVSGYLWLVILIGMILVGAFLYFKETPGAKYLLSNLSFELPIFGRLNKDVTFAIMSRTLGALVGSGVGILEALKITKGVVGTNIYREGLDQAILEVEKGFPLSLSLRNNQIFPSIIAQMVGIGEETGALDKSLERLAVFFEGAVERRLKVLTTALEPALMVIMGVGIAGLAVAVLMPMFNLVNVIK